MRNSWKWLLAIYLIVLGTRLFFAFHTPFYTTDDSYLHLRLIDSLQEGNLLAHDPLGYGGRTLILSPLFDIALAALDLLFGTTALKIIINVLASLLIIPAYLLAHQLTNDKLSSLTSAMLAGFVPAFIANTFNHLTPLALAIPLFFFLAYAWLKTPKKPWTFIGLLLLFAFLHPLSILFVLSIGAWFVLLAVERTRIRTARYELGLFALFFVLWVQFLLYKKLILFHGPAVIWQNIPAGLLSNFYSDITILSAFWQTGFITLFGGTYVLYRVMHKKHEKDAYFLLSITLVTAFLLWLKLIAISTGLAILGITLTILYSRYLLLLRTSLKKTKFARLSTLFVTTSIILALLTTIYPSYLSITTELRHTITEEEVTALTWLGKTTPPTATIIAPPEYGHYITAIAKRSNVMDDYYFLQPRVNERHQDITRLYTTSLETEAVRLFDKYNASHLIVPPSTPTVKFTSPCFEKTTAKRVSIYEKDPECKVEAVA